MENLLRQAQSAIRKTDEVSSIRIEVNEVLGNTVDKINELIKDVDDTVGGIRTISQLTGDCDTSRGQIVDAMTTLSSVSEENAASTEQTSASMEELDGTIGTLTESARNLNEVAERMNSELEFFKI